MIELYGSGDTENSVCHQCNGDGIVDNPDVMSNMAYVNCPECKNPEGKDYQCPCNDCNGVENDA